MAGDTLGNAFLPPTSIPQPMSVCLSVCVVYACALAHKAHLEAIG